MKSHNITILDLVCSLIKDAAITFGFNPVRDIKTVIQRTKNEGISFLTITLPSFCQDFDRSLDNGKIAPTSFRAFKKHKKDELIPAFLQGITARVFRSSGEVLDGEISDEVYFIRQITAALKKVNLRCTDKRKLNAAKSYIKDEDDLKVKVSKNDLLQFRSVSRALWYHALNYQLGYSFADSIGKHGPGATADRYRGNQKFRCLVYHDRLERYFPALGFLYPISAWDSDVFQKVKYRPVGAEQSVKVISVPKTLKTTRIIAMEPTCMQYAQQSLSHLLKEMLETHVYTKGHINFTSQRVNRRIALRSSVSRKYATLDLSAASDRVPKYLVSQMLDSNKEFRQAVFACRSRTADLSGFSPSFPKRVRLRKFASMGSALCFPVEAMYFYTICVMALLDGMHLPLSHESLKKVTREIYVYGDDIIVPTGMVDIVISYLQKYHCKVGSNKSFWNGNFRESCGMDAFRGEPVNPVYFRQDLPRSRTDASALISLVATRNLLYYRGCWVTVRLLDAYLLNYIGEMPIVGQTAGCLGRHSFLRVFSMHTWSKRFHMPMVKAYVPESPKIDDSIKGYPALAKCLHSDKSSECGHSLESSVQPYGVTLRRRWTSPFGIRAEAA